MWLFISSGFAPGYFEFKQPESGIFENQWPKQNTLSKENTVCYKVSLKPQIIHTPGKFGFKIIFIQLLGCLSQPNSVVT